MTSKEIDDNSEFLLLVLVPKISISGLCRKYLCPYEYSDLGYCLESCKKDILMMVRKAHNSIQLVPVERVNNT